MQGWADYDSVNGKSKGAITELMYHLFTTFLASCLIYLTHFCACLNKGVMVWL